jgi:hypothetical protein
MREGYWPDNVTLDREPYVPEFDAPVRRREGFVPPSGPSQGRVEHVGSAGSTLTRTIYGDEGPLPVQDPHPARRDLDAEAIALARAARDSILRPAHLKRGTNHD